MSDNTSDDLSFDEFDDVHFPRPEEPEFTAIADRMLSRRRLLTGAAAMGAGAFLAGAGVAIPRATRAAANNWLPFEPVAASTMDTITVPKGFNWHVLTRWGDPLWSNAAPFDPVTRGTGASQERSFGDNTDGMALFTKDGRSVLCVNNEFCNRKICLLYTSDAADE